MFSSASEKFAIYLKASEGGGLRGGGFKIRVKKVAKLSEKLI